MAVNYPHIGSIIGTGQVTNSNVLTVTLSSDAPVTEPDNYNGLHLVICSSEPTAVAPIGSFDVADDIERTPLNVTDSLGVQTGPPYGSGFQNTFNPSKQAWLSALDIGGTNYMVRGAWDYVIYHPLVAGDTITIDYSHVPYTIPWLGCNVHASYSTSPVDPKWRELTNPLVVWGLPQSPSPYIDIVNGIITYNNGGSFYTYGYNPKWWQALCGLFFATNDVTFDFTTSGAFNVNTRYFLNLGSTARFRYGWSSQFNAWHSAAILTINLFGTAGKFVHYSTLNGGTHRFGGEPYPAGQKGLISNYFKAH